ncbi:phosphopantothenoylcysteine decarboxylase [Enterococcus sp. DIV2402]|jgi:phosphopantothenoylcysteine decarboxylase|uniref:Phosphopantothenoylcysteine decarboxylase n=1 Tax=Candidatus Enterococcus lowellii TaxID=2230877 RepID=A0ABZ2SL36_9ENTE|nr:phosphopantothenoylcysteine decarboxylase [Enterococcus sp. DIV2402]MBO0464607.1 phosphopantothenoylcysteine decarboxylase [Enterococcus sp. DIV2402]
MMKKRILLGVSGSISAYKSADLTNELTKLGYEVDVMMTKSSQAFITPLTLQSLSKRPIHTDVMEEIVPEKINHIELAKQADLFIVAPASANIIGKLAHGLADDLISTVALALPFDVPKIVAPAMNTNMYLNPLMQKNLAILKEVGYKEITPRQSLLACGDFGTGALATVETIVAQVKATLEA